MGDGFDMEISWGPAVVRLATSKSVGGLRGGLSPGQVAEYAGEVFDCIRTKVLPDNGNAGCLDGCGKSGCVVECGCRKCLLAGRFARFEFSAVGSRGIPTLCLEQGCPDVEAKLVSEDCAGKFVPLVSDGCGRGTNDVPGVCSSLRSDGSGTASGVSGRGPLEASRPVTSCVDGGMNSKVSVQRNKNWERNQRKKIARKERKKTRQFLGNDWRDRSVLSSQNSSGSSEVSVGNPLRISLEKKWEVENALATERARRQLEVLKATDVDQEIRRYRTKVSAATERNMVSIEQTHAKLRQTGNVPGEGGFAETIISGGPGLSNGSGTISPDSSASMAEFRACQKALLDAEREISEYKRKVKIASEKYGFPLEQVDFLDKEVWTDTQTNQDILDGIYPNGYGKDTSLFEDGKFRAIGV